MTLADQALELQKSGCNCAQSVSGVFCEKYGIDRDQLMRMTTNFGSGMNAADYCGALAGAIMVVGFKYGTTDPKDLDGKKLCRQKAAEIIKAFRKEKNTLHCREMMGCDITIPENFVKMKPRIIKECTALMHYMVTVLEEAGY